MHTFNRSKESDRVRSAVSSPLVGAAIALGLSATALGAEAMVSVDHGEALSVPLSQGVTLGGAELWTGSLNVPGQWTVSVQLSIDGSLEEGRVLSGTLEAINHGAQPRQFELDLRLPSCDGIDGATVLSAQTRLQLVANANGGYIRVPGGEKGLQVFHDDAAAGHAYNGPFFVTASGAGVATVFGNFSNAAAPALVDDHRLRMRYELSDGDTARLLITRIDVSAANDVDLLACEPEAGIPGDINGDGLVNVHDLLILLSSWGHCPGCPADLDGNGMVDIGDVMLLLAAWN